MRALYKTKRTKTWDVLSIERDKHISKQNMFRVLIFVACENAYYIPYFTHVYIFI